MGGPRNPLSSFPPGAEVLSVKSLCRTHLADAASLAEGADRSHVALVPWAELRGVVGGGGVQGDAGVGTHVSGGLQVVALAEQRQKRGRAHEKDNSDLFVCLCSSWPRFSLRGEFDPSTGVTHLSTLASCLIGINFELGWYSMQSTAPTNPKWWVICLTIFTHHPHHLYSLLLSPICGTICTWLIHNNKLLNSPMDSWKQEAWFVWGTKAESDHSPGGIMNKLWKQREQELEWWWATTMPDSSQGLQCSLWLDLHSEPSGNKHPSCSGRAICEADQNNNKLENISEGQHRRPLGNNQTGS